MNPRIGSLLCLSSLLVALGCSEKTSAAATTKTPASSTSGSTSTSASTTTASTATDPVAAAPANSTTNPASTPVTPGAATPASIASPAPVTEAPKAPLLESPTVQSGNFKVTANGNQVSLPGLMATMPSDWKLTSNPEAPRLATFLTPEGMNVSVFWFGPTAGGTVDENVKRWDALFSPLNSREVQKDTIHNPRIVFGRWQGGFHGDMGGAKVDKPDAMVLLTAIIQGPKGSVFLKAVGTMAQTSAARGDLRSMVWGAKPVN